METEYDDQYNVHQQAGPRSAQQLTINFGLQALSVITRASFVCGMSLALCVVCAGIAWWAITENRVTQSKLDRIEAVQEQCNAK